MLGFVAEFGRTDDGLGILREVRIAKHSNLLTDGRDAAIGYFDCGQWLLSVDFDFGHVRFYRSSLETSGQPQGAAREADVKPVIAPLKLANTDQNGRLRSKQRGQMTEAAKVIASRSPGVYVRDDAFTITPTRLFE